MLFILTVLQTILLPVVFFFRINKLVRVFLLLFISFFLVINIVQLTSLFVSTQYVSVLAIFNAGEMSALGLKMWMYFILSLVIVVSVYCVSFKLLYKFSTKIKLVLFFLLLISLFVSDMPIKSIFKTGSVVVKSLFLNKLSDKELSQIERDISRDYVVRDSSIENYLKTGENEKTNIIVIFVEGMSYEIISKELTPNIYKYEKESISLINYYNHTAATFRGLRGQLTSSYQMVGGSYGNGLGVGQLKREALIKKYSNSRLTTLPTTLKHEGYSTYFQTPLSRGSNLNVMLETLGFTDVYGYEDFSGDINLEHDAISDKDNFELLYDNLMRIKKPFFYGIYVRDTHLGMNSRNLKFGDGNNTYLNQFYNMDYWFGEFIEKLQKAESLKNTLVIFTTDHATYPHKDFLETFNVNNKYFVGKIPFFIMSNGISPRKIDVNGKNSLSFAPTVLDIVGIREIGNNFLGASIFDTSVIFDKNYIYAEGDTYIDTRNSKPEIINNADIVKKIKQLQKFGDR